MKRIFVVVLVLLLSVVLYCGTRFGLEISKAASEDPAVWAAEIAAFERADREQPPPPEPILFVGSSSIRLWRSLAEDMAPLVVLRRGFGGAKIGDVVSYADRIITPYRPRAVVVYVGGNDLWALFGNAAKEPEQVVSGYRELVAKLHAAAPQTPVCFIALKATLRSADQRKRTRAVNALTARYVEEDPRLHFIDANAGLQGADGEPDPRFLMLDGMHLNAQGYAVWAPAIRERLLSDLGS